MQIAMSLNDKIKNIYLFRFLSIHDDCVKVFVVYWEAWKLHQTKEWKVK